MKCHKKQNDTFNSEVIETKFFDITTDIGIPTIYCLQIAKYKNEVENLII